MRIGIITSSESRVFKNNIVIILDLRSENYYQIKCRSAFKNTTEHVTGMFEGNSRSTLSIWKSRDI